MAEKMTSAQVRESFIKFFESKGQKHFLLKNKLF